MASIPIGLGSFTETDVASAATCDIGAVSTIKVRITGSVTITSFGAGTNRLRFIRFAAALTLTHNAVSLRLPTNASIAVEAGDTCFAMSTAVGNWVVVQYQRDTGAPLVPSALDADLTAIAALTTTSYGRALLELANAGALRTAGGLVIGTDVQAYALALDEWAAKARPAGVTVGTTDTQALTNKTIDYASNTLPGVAGTAAANTFTAAQTITVTAAGAALSMNSTDDGAVGGPFLEIARNSPTPAVSDAIGSIRFSGQDSALAAQLYSCIDTYILDPTAGTEDAMLQFRTVVNGAMATIVTCRAGAQIGAPTGGDKGAGTLNAVGVYDDNVLLTCVPMQPEFLQEGRVDLDKWDAVAPKGHHPVAHAFAKLLESGCDPRSPQSYIERAKRDAALPGMPTLEEWQHSGLSTGEMLTRLWLAVEMLAVAWMHAYEKDAPP